MLVLKIKNATRYLNTKFMIEFKQLLLQLNFLWQSIEGLNQNINTGSICLSIFRTPSLWRNPRWNL